MFLVILCMADTMRSAADTMRGAADTMPGAADTMTGAADTMRGAADKMRGAANKVPPLNTQIIMSRVGKGSYGHNHINAMGSYAPHGSK